MSDISPNHSISDMGEDVPTKRVSFSAKYSFYQNNDDAAVTSSSSIESDNTEANEHVLDLPEFNKRPLSDTPVVSSVTSPDDTAADNDDQTDQMGVPVTIIKTNNISNLNLASENPSFSPHPTHIPAIATPTNEMSKPPSLDQIKDILKQKTKGKRKAATLDVPGQTRSKTSPDGTIAVQDVASKLVIVMVGLPARGKSYITNKLTRYLNWLQHDARVFNVGNTRRRDTKNVGPESKPLPDIITPTKDEARDTELDVNKIDEKIMLVKDSDPHGKLEHSASFFNPDNSQTTALREKWAMDTLDQLLDYVVDGEGSVGIFDATNSTKARRARVFRRIEARSNGELKVLFLESVCSDPAIIESNIRLKLSGPDYKNMDPDIALRDFVGRLANYEKAYQTIDDEEEKIPNFQYCKMIDVGKKVVAYNIKGFLASQTVYFLLNFNLSPRQIWITRHGESKDNVLGRIGGDSSLTERGERFSSTLARFMKFQREEFRKKQLEEFSQRLQLKFSADFYKNGEFDPETIPTEPNFCVWTSMLSRSIETAQFFNEDEFFVKEMRMLDELGAGKCDGLTYEEIQRFYPKEFKERIDNKLSYRYPGVGGESYLDVITRLRPVIAEVERTTDHLLIISHRVVARVLLGYFLNLDKSAIGELDVPLHTLYCLETKPYGTEYHLYEYDEVKDWFFKVNPEQQKTYQQVGVAFRERKFSVVPTAPTSKLPRSRSKLKLGMNRNVEDLRSLRSGVGNDVEKLNEKMFSLSHKD